MRWLVAMCTAVGGLAVLGCLPASAAEPPPLEAYGRLPAIEMPELSPTGDRIAFVTVVAGERKLVVKSADGALLHDVKIHDMKLRNLSWADNDHLLIVVTVTMTLLGVDRPERNEYPLAVSLNIPQHKLSIPLSNQPGFLPELWGVYGVNASKGHAYGYFGAVRIADLHLKGVGYIGLYRVDLDSGAYYQLAHGGLLDQAWFIDPAASDRAATTLKDQANGDWRVIRGDTVVARGRSGFGGPAVLGFGRTAGTLLIAEPTEGDEVVREVKMDGSGGVDEAGDAAVSRFIIDRATGRWIGEVDQADYARTRFFDPEMEARARAAVAAAAGASAVLVSWSDGLDQALVRTEGLGDSGTYRWVNTRTAASQVVGRAYPELPADQVGEVRPVDWTAADGLALHGVLTLPRGRAAHNLPLVVMPHGGPHARDYPRFDWWAQAFASRGYAVFQPNFRGSSGDGEKLFEAGFGQWGRKMQTDISDGVAALGKAGVVDIHRACIVGGSYGGYAALAGVTVQQGLYRCAVSWGGIADPAAMVRSDIPFAGPEKTDSNRYWRRFLGVTDLNLARLDDVSPLRLAARADAPILLMFGLDDTVVSPRQSNDMAQALKRAGKSVEVVSLPGEDHWLSKSATRVAMLKAAVAFVLKNDPPD